MSRAAVVLLALVAAILAVGVAHEVGVGRATRPVAVTRAASAPRERCAAMLLALNATERERGSGAPPLSVGEAWSRCWEEAR